MIARLDVPFHDVAAAELRFSLAVPARDGLGACRLTTPDMAVELRVLGASHQAVAEHEGGSLVETVACLPGRPAPVPSRLDRQFDGGRYAFASTTLRPGRAHLHEMAATLLQRSEQDPLAVTGVFPGVPDAITALELREVPGGAAWVTHHVYPGAGEIVRTTGRLLVA